MNTFYFRHQQLTQKKTTNDINIVVNNNIFTYNNKQTNFSIHESK